jgi:hypothetical protein
VTARSEGSVIAVGGTSAAMLLPFHFEGATTMSPETKVIWNKIRSGEIVHHQQLQVGPDEKCIFSLRPRHFVVIDHRRKTCSEVLNAKEAARAFVDLIRRSK